MLRVFHKIAQKQTIKQTNILNQNQNNLVLNNGFAWEKICKNCMPWSTLVLYDMSLLLGHWLPDGLSWTSQLYLYCWQLYLHC